MSMIFDGFKTRAAAEDFVAFVEQEYGLDGSVHDTVESSDAADPFPFNLNPPIAHIERAERLFSAHHLSPEAIEEQIEDAAGNFGGTYAGT